MPAKSRSRFKLYMPRVARYVAMIDPVLVPAANAHAAISGVRADARYHWVSAGLLCTTSLPWNLLNLSSPNKSNQHHYHCELPQHQLTKS